MNDKSLRAQLIGAWRLVSYIESPVDGSPKRSPLGENPQGIIMYTPDGYMSAQLMRPGRRNFASNDWFKGTPGDLRLNVQFFTNGGVTRYSPLLCRNFLD